MSPLRVSPAAESSSGALIVDASVPSMPVAVANAHGAAQIRSRALSTAPGQAFLARRCFQHHRGTCASTGVQTQLCCGPAHERTALAGEFPRQHPGLVNSRAGLGGSDRQGSKGRERRWAESAQLLLNQCNPQRPGLISARTILVLQFNRVPSQPNHKLLSKHSMVGPDMLSHGQEAKAAFTKPAEKEGRLHARQALLA